MATAPAAGTSAPTGAQPAAAPGEGVTPPAPTSAAPAAAPASILEQVAAGLKPAETKPAEGAPWSPKVPEGVALDKSVLESFSALATKTKATPEVAQAFFDAYAQQLQAAQADFDAREAKWAEEVWADPALGSTRQAREESLKAAGRAAAKFGPEVLAELTKHGLGSNPVIVRFLAQVGRAMGSESIAGTMAPQSQSPRSEDQLRALFPNSPQLFGAS